MYSTETFDFLSCCNKFINVAFDSMASVIFNLHQRRQVQQGLADVIRLTYPKVAVGVVD